MPSAFTDFDVQRFKKEGCPNCEEVLGLRGSDDSIDACTSSVYEGLITLVEPSKSWVAKWQRLDGYVKGVYATKVMGQLPDELITEMEQNYKIRYMPYVYKNSSGAKASSSFPGCFPDATERETDVDREL